MRIANKRDNQRLLDNQQQPARTAAQRVAVKKKAKRRSVAGHVFFGILMFGVLAAAGFAVWYYWWTNHATFEYELQPVVILYGQSITPEEFIYPSEVMENVSASFSIPRFRIYEGRQEVPMTLTLGWRTIETTAYLYAMTTIYQIDHEYRMPGPELRAIDMVANADVAAGIPFDVAFVENPLPLDEYEVESHILQLILNDAPFEVILHVADTTPPTATAVDRTIKIGETVTPEDFIVSGSIFDESPIYSVAFVDEMIDLPRRDQIVEVAIEDIHGNQTIINASLTVQLNQTPPVIEGTGTIEALLGRPILYLPGVTAYDDFGRSLTDYIEVDSSGVDQHAVGMYTVIYRVTDYTGNSVQVEETVHVLDIDPDYVNEQVDALLAGIINDNMTQVQMALAIHRWVRNNMTYASVRGGPDSAYDGAYRALRDRRGNCFIYYSISTVMLTRAGIPTMRVERIDGTPTRHRWNLINPDDLGWHHYDSVPIRLEINRDRMAFFTDTEARYFTSEMLRVNGMRDYFTYNTDFVQGIEIVQ